MLPHFLSISHLHKPNVSVPGGKATAWLIDVRSTQGQQKATNAKFRFQLNLKETILNILHILLHTCQDSKIIKLHTIVVFHQLSQQCSKHTCCFWLCHSSPDINTSVWNTEWDSALLTLKQALFFFKKKPNQNNQTNPTYTSFASQVAQHSKP